MENIIISNPDDLEKIKKRISKEGEDKFHVIADFDKTLTRAFYKSHKNSSIISHLRNGGYLTKNYAPKSNALFDKYHPIEIDPNIPIRDKDKPMYEWWKAHKLLLIESGFDKKTIKKCVKDMIKEDGLRFREGVGEFFSTLNKNNIPLIIMSASLGSLVGEFMKQKGFLSDNVHIIANLFDFDEKGKAIAIKKIVHVFNKHEMEVEDTVVKKELSKRKNVILLGDSLGDLGMVEGFAFENIIKIGFLNENVQEWEKEFKENYDVIILNDGNFDYINELITEIIND